MLATRTKHDRFISCLCMGTVQLGMPYGIANQSGMPDKAAALGLLTAAMDAGITLFDTAHAYGQSEMRLGLVQDGLAQKHATILTKLSPLDDTAEHSLKPLEAKVEASVRQSLQDLNLPSLPYLLLHRASHLREQDGKIWSLLLDFQKQGLIEKLGVSVATPQEALDALCVPEVECIQLPYNLLDWRWEQAGIPELLARRPDVLVLARSAFLQGLFMLPVAGWPTLMRKEGDKVTAKLDEWVVDFKRKSRADLCIAFVRGQPWIDSVVVGMETVQQLQDNIALFNEPPLGRKACEHIRADMPRLGEDILNPSYWPAVKEQHSA
jgi:aryl-alcohol dehydrogenase-like predicted oxidoreductase